MQSDIVELARERAISYRECGPSAEHTAAMLDELASHVERLRAELAASTAESIDLFKQLVAMREQRDEARREACLWALPQGVVWNEAMIARGTVIAAERGWDCFAQQEGGGA